MRRFRLAWWFAAFAAAAVLLGNRGFRRLLSGMIELRRLRREFSTLQREEGELKSRIERVKTSDQALESAVRRELGYLKQGETEYRFPAPKKP